MTCASPRAVQDDVCEAVVGKSSGDSSVNGVIAVPDDKLGQVILVVAKGDGTTEERLRQRLRHDLPSFMQPSRYIWLAELPRNANGKLDRAAIRGMTS